jgi:hypothetical protein
MIFGRLQVTTQQFLIRVSLIISFSSWLQGCTASIDVDTQKPNHPVRTIGLDFGSGVIGERIGKLLGEHGYNVVSQEAMLKMVRNQLGINSIDPSRVDQLTKLKTQNIDAYLTCRSTFRPVEFTWKARGQPTPDRVELNLFSSHSGQKIVAISWQNGHQWFESSISDASESLAMRLIEEMQK